MAVKTNSAICGDAFRIAEAMFNSDSFYLYAPPPDTLDLSSSFVMKPSNIGGDHAFLIFDAQILRAVPRTTWSRALTYFYWQENPQHGFRFVIDADPVGWRGDLFNVYALPEGVKAEDFSVSASNQVSIAGGIFSSWRPPLMLRMKNSGMLWGIFVGQNFTPLASWTVFSLAPSGEVKNCTIAFAPPLETTYLDLLPKDVRKLAQLLNGTLGRGENEGTLQPTARLRLDAEWVWANAAVRPWAVHSREPSNTREQVDEGLLAWSRINKSHTEHFTKMVEQYPRAEKALANYYHHHFHKSPEESATLAKTVLDFAYRTYFRFSVIN